MNTNMEKILETRESLAGQNELFDEENDEDEDTSDDDDDPSNASDTSIADPQPNGAPKAHTNGVFAGSSSGDGARYVFPNAPVPFQEPL